MATGGGGGRNKTGLVGRGAKPAALEGALLGRLERWRSCEQFLLSPSPHALHLYTNHPKLLSRFQPFSRFLSPKDGAIKHRVCRERTRRTGGGEEAPFPAGSSHTITAFGTKPRGLSCICAAGTPRGWASREGPDTLQPHRHQRFISKKRSLDPPLCELTEKEKHFLRSFWFCISFS